jgi:hypothetical protein
VSDLTTDAFLATLQRSISRQGCPSDLCNPQTLLTEDPSDCSVLTPGIFLIIPSSSLHSRITSSRLSSPQHGRSSPLPIY